MAYNIKDREAFLEQEAFNEGTAVLVSLLTAYRNQEGAIEAIVKGAQRDIDNKDPSAQSDVAKFQRSRKKEVLSAFADPKRTFSLEKLLEDPEPRDFGKLTDIFSDATAKAMTVQAGRDAEAEEKRQAEAEKERIRTKNKEHVEALCRDSQLDIIVEALKQLPGDTDDPQTAKTFRVFPSSGFGYGSDNFSTEITISYGTKAQEYRRKNPQHISGGMFGGGHEAVESSNSFTIRVEGDKISFVNHREVIKEKDAYQAHSYVTYHDTYPRTEYTDINQAVKEGVMGWLATAATDRVEDLRKQILAPPEPPKEPEPPAQKKGKLLRHHRP